MFIYLGAACAHPQNATLSSTLSNDTSGEKCIDGNLEANSKDDICSTEEYHSYPFLVLEYGRPVRVTGLTLYNRGDCCGERTSSLHAIVTDEYPEDGEKAEGIIAISFFGEE